MGIKFNSLVIMNFLDLIYLMNIFTIFIIKKKKIYKQFKILVKNAIKSIYAYFSRNE